MYEWSKMLTGTVLSGKETFMISEVQSTLIDHTQSLSIEISSFQCHSTSLQCMHGFCDKTAIQSACSATYIFLHSNLLVWCHFITIHITIKKPWFWSNNMSATENTFLLKQVRRLTVRILISYRRSNQHGMNTYCYTIDVNVTCNCGNLSISGRNLPLLTVIYPASFHPKWLDSFVWSQSVQRLDSDRVKLYLISGTMRIVLLEHHRCPSPVFVIL